MNRDISQWLADWTGVPSGAQADGATWQLDSAWSWAPWATVLFVLGTIVAISVLYARESSSARRAYRTLLAMLRLAVIGLVLVMLAQWAIAVRLTGRPSVALIVDHSASMAIADRYNDNELPTAMRERLVASGLSGPTRLNLAKFIATQNDAQLLGELAKRYQLDVYLTAANVERIDEAGNLAALASRIRKLTADGPASQVTRLGDAVRYVLENFRGAPPAAIVLLTDGVVTEGVPLSDAAKEARRNGVPILTVGLGSSQAPRDIELADVLVDDAVFINDLVSFQVQIKSTGLEGERAKVTLRREGDSSPLAEEEIELPPSGQILSARLVNRPTTAGDVPYVIEIAPREDETDKQNNRQQRVVAVRDEKIRVLVVQGYPNYEFRFLKTLLERDSSVQLSTYLQDADPDYAEQDKTALRSIPVGRDEILAYDVLIIGDVDPRLVPRSFWQNVRAFVSEKGGGAAFIVGPRYLPWLYADNPEVAALLPIDLKTVTLGDHVLPREITRGFEVEPTQLGLQSPAFQIGDTPAETERIWRSLAPLYWIFEGGDLKPAAQVLANAAVQERLPAVCFQHVGAGRVLFHAIDSTWRWRIGGEDAYFARYWVQTIRFLARGKLSSGRGAQLAADRREYRSGEAVQLRARFLEPRLAASNIEVSVVLSSAGQTRRRVTLQRNPSAEGVFEGTLADLAAGSYEAVLTEPQVPGNPPTARFSVVAPPGELARLDMDAAALKNAAEITHGKFYTIASADQLLADLPAGRRVPIKNLPPISIWNRWWLLAAFLACITSEWILRKRKGML